MPEIEGDVTALLAQVRAGNREAADRLFSLIYLELKRTARAFMKCERPSHTLQPTALVHEAYVKMIRGRPGWRNRTHFYATAAINMKEILKDYARARVRLKRGGLNNRRSDISAEHVKDPKETGNVIDLIAWHEAHRGLEKLDPDLAQLMELRVFQGMSLEEAAEVMERPPKTIKAMSVLMLACLRDLLGAAKRK